jgi:CHAD domain-containing protein
MRVAIRRLRSALQNFEGSAAEPLINKRVYKEFLAERKRLGKIGDLLGAVRDHDVLDEYLKDYAKERLKLDIAQCEGLAQFERFLQTERAAAFSPMVKRINRAQEVGKLREEFGRWALGLPAISVPPLTLREAALIIIPQRIADVHAHAPALQDGADSEGHHEFRKTLRRLRYALETLGVCFSGPLKGHIKTLVQAQDILGEMQDRDVLRASAHKAFPSGEPIIAEDGSEVEQLPPDIAEFLKWGEMRRRRLLGQARKWWEVQQDGGILSEIEKLLGPSAPGA